MESAMRIRFFRRNKRNASQRGMTLIELLMGMGVLTVGMTGGLLLMVTAIATNNRNKLDTGATAVAAMVVEQISSRSSQSSNPLPPVVTDCRPEELGGPQDWEIDGRDASGTGAGARLTSSGLIDLTESYASVPDGYKMRFVACGAQGRQITYDVRWNVRKVSPYTNLVTISAKAVSVNSGTGDARLFALPVTMRTMVGY
jgi:prepilin-type N-terminal cleavage/methylation domain-containing protein